MALLPLAKINERLSVDRDDSYTALFNALLLKAELITKLTVIGFVAMIPDDVENTRYAHAYELVRANSVGSWADLLRQLLTGPTKLPDSVREVQNQLTERNQRDSWQHQAVVELSESMTSLNLAGQPVPRNVPLLQWFNDFATLRNKTRGHGATPPNVIAKACPHLERSLDLIESNFRLFDLPWAYIHQNLSGKYRVLYWGNQSSNFEELKRRDETRLANGVYIDSGELHHVELVHSNIDGSDIWIANGKFTDRNYEMLSYWTDARHKGSVDLYLRTPEPLPPSETHGIGELDTVGDTFTNLPVAPLRYIGRHELEKELREQLMTTDRHPIVTLTGYGGIGKTSLALTVIRQMLQENVSPYEVVVWFSARDVDLLSSGPKRVRPAGISVEDFAREYIDLMGHNAEPAGQTGEATYLRQQMGVSSDFRTLFVFDNFETVAGPRSIYDWIDTYIRNPNKVLITSRENSFKGDYSLRVSGMTEDECSELIDDTSSSLRISHLVTEDYKRQLIQESTGHPYVVKILLGELAKNPQVTSVQRVTARQDNVLNALFDRSYGRLSSAAQQVFLTLCSWRSSVPRIGLEAVLLRPENEMMDVNSSIEELLQMSLIEEIIADDDDETLSELTIPLAARLFGQKKLEISPWRALIKANSDFLQLFGAVTLGRSRTDTEAREERVIRFAKTAAREIERGRKSLEDVLAVLEYVAQQISRGWLLMADLIEEFAKENKDDRKLNYLLKYVENPTSMSHPPIETWLQIATIHERCHNLYEAVDAFAQIFRQPNVPTDKLSETVSDINRLFRSNDTSDLPRELRQILLQDVIDAMEARMSDLNGDDCSRLAWLHMNLGNIDEARIVTETGLQIDPHNIHCVRLVERLG